MSNPVILHNPRCSKSRQTLALLEDKGLNPVVREYLNEPLDAGELSDLLGKLGMAPGDIIRPKEQKALELPADGSAEELIGQIASHPRIMQRPIVIHGDKAAIGRPPEQVLDLFS